MIQVKPLRKPRRYNTICFSSPVSTIVHWTSQVNWVPAEANLYWSIDSNYLLSFLLWKKLIMKTRWKSLDYRLVTRWKGWKSWKSIQTKKKAGITGCPAPQWAARLAVFQFVKYISEIAHFLSPVEFWEITRWWPALFGFVNRRLMQAPSVDTRFVSHETFHGVPGKTFSLD